MKKNPACPVGGCHRTGVNPVLKKPSLNSGQKCNLLNALSNNKEADELNPQTTDNYQQTYPDLGGYEV